MSDVIRGGGVAGELVRSTDWAKTPLGPMNAWPLSLATMVRVMLSTRQATCLFWGPDLVNLYNDGFVPILGEKHPAAMGQPARELWSDAWPVVGELLNGVVARGDAVLFTEMLIPIVRKGVLEDAWWNYSYSPSFDDEGNVVGVLVVATETTNEVAGRKALEAANLAKDEFLATLSHELRTPLNAILGWSKLLDPESGALRLDKGLTVIRRNAEAQSRLIEDILDVSRIISGKVVIELRRLRLGTVIENVTESLRPAATAKGVRLTVTVDPGIEVTADEDRFQQIVWNLLSNAVKFTPAGGEVRMVGAMEGSSVSIQVIDTGKGMAAAFLPHVFDRFRQGDGSTTKVHGGLGLGLAIVRHLVELHGGTVTARSDGEGLGSTFGVLLPVRAIQSVEPSTGSARDPSASNMRAAPDRTALADLRILVVDDVRDAREMVAAALQAAGATVSEASSAEGAMTVLASSPIDVVVSDIGMPNEDGYSLVQRIRASEIPAVNAVPALALTAFARAQDRKRVLEAGFHDHLAKPVDPAILVERIAALARNRGD